MTPMQPPIATNRGANDSGSLRRKHTVLLSLKPRQGADFLHHIVRRNISEEENHRPYPNRINVHYTLMQCMTLTLMGGFPTH